jgi:hypothetical protein
MPTNAATLGFKSPGNPLPALPRSVLAGVCFPGFALDGRCGLRPVRRPSPDPVFDEIHFSGEPVAQMRLLPQLRD